VTTQPDTDAPPTDLSMIPHTCMNEDMDEARCPRCGMEDSDAPLEGRPTTEAACLKCGHDVDHTTECPGGCPMCARYPSHPPRSLDEELSRIESTYPTSEGRPTTPQTEAGRELLDASDVLLMMSGDEIIGLNEGELELHILAIEREAAAGALPSVPLEEREDFKVGFHRGVRVGYLRGKRAALPEASEQ
jgi:hypothetical protein